MGKLSWIIWVVPKQSQVSLHVKEKGRRVSVQVMWPLLALKMKGHEPQRASSLQTLEMV